METKINIAEILKDKPQGTILYDYLHNIDVEFDNVETTEIETSIWCTSDKGGYNELFGYSKLGTLRGWLDGLQILLPSKEMRDWRKFAWKKGDVLVSKHGTTEVIFDGFEDDTYTSFKGKHALKTIEGESEYMGDSVDDYGEFYTENYYLESEDAAQTYINAIEKRLGGKLNRETLEIENAHPEFKDGDILACISSKGCIYIFIFRYFSANLVSYYINKDTYDNLFFANGFIQSNEYNIRYATEEEKHQLFDALEKKGKTWDAEKKQIVDLKPKIEFKPFDKVVVRDTEYSTWCADLFSHIDEDYRYACVGATWSFCIPYNEETAKLIGTTNNVEG